MILNLCSRSNLAMEVTESKKTKYTYPFGLGSFLMSGCYQSTVMSGDSTSVDGSAPQDGTTFRKKRQSESQDSASLPHEKKETQNFMSFCNRYAQLEQTKECFVIYIN